MGRRDEWCVSESLELKRSYLYEKRKAVENVNRAKIISICNQKGGVAKTTTTVNLAAGLARQGYDVLVMDCDPQGDLTKCLGWRDSDNLPVTLATLMQKVIQEIPISLDEGILHHEEGVNLIPSNIELSAMEMTLVNAMSRERTIATYLDKVKENYDYVLIDCMPSLGMLTVNALTASDSVIIPVQAQYLSAIGMTQLLQTVNRVKKFTNPKLKVDGILLTMVDRRTNLSKEVGGDYPFQLWREDSGLSVADSGIGTCCRNVLYGKKYL